MEVTNADLYIILKDSPGSIKIWRDKRTPAIRLCKCFIFFKIRPSLTTSKDGLKRRNIHLETTRI